MKKRFIYIFFSVIIITIITGSEFFHLNTVHSEQNESIPEIFFLSDINTEKNKGSIIPGLKDQGPYSTCWAFSTLGAMESNLLKKGIYMDFSEAFLSYTPYSGLESFPQVDSDISYLNNKGSHYIASSVLAAGRGMTSEKEIGYNASSSTIDLIIAQKPKSPPEFIVKDIDYLSPFISPVRSVDENNIKNIIYTRKEPVVCYVSVDEKYFNLKTCAINYSEKYHSLDDNNSHAVMLIGWDDNYSRNNFKENHIPAENGAWCAWSSSTYGDNSEKGEILWISYEDNSLINPVVYSSVEPNYYQNIYQYDTYGWTTSINCSFLPDSKSSSNKLDPNKYSSGLMANIFKAKDSEYISSVGFYTIDEKTRYRISIFTDINIPDSSEGHAIPIVSSQYINGRIPVMAEGEIKLPGFHVIDLYKIVPVRKGTYFSVVIEISTYNSSYCFPIEAKVEYSCEKEAEYTLKNLIYSNRLIGANESFIYNPELQQWTDLSGFFMSNRHSYLEMEYTYPDVENCFLLPYPELAKMSDNKDDPENAYKFNKMHAVIGNLCIKAFSERQKPGDLDFNTDINVFDLMKFKKEFLLSDSCEQYSGNKEILDINNDNIISISDLSELKKNILFLNNENYFSEKRVKDIYSKYSISDGYTTLNTSDIKK